jgi:hypothetical protein
VFDRFRVNPVVSTIVVSLAAGLFAASDQERLLPALVLVAGMTVAVAIVVVLYRQRGFLAAWVAGIAAGLSTTAMALASLEDQELTRSSNLLLAIVVMIAAAGAYGVGRRLLQKPAALHPSAKLGIDRG